MKNVVDGLIDTNILVYAYDESDKRKHEIAGNLLISCFLEKKIFAVSLQNLNEFYFTVTKRSKKILDPTTARNIVAEIMNFQSWKKLQPDDETILKAMELHGKHNTPYWDALLAGIMLQKNVVTIYTENVDDFKNIPGIIPVNPFA